MMKRVLLPFIGAAVLFACNSEPEGYELTGNLRGDIENGTQVFLKK